MRCTSDPRNVVSILLSKNIYQGVQDQRTVHAPGLPAWGANDHTNDHCRDELHREEDTPIHTWIGWSHFEQVNVQIAEVPETECQGNEQPVDDRRPFE